VAVLTSAEWRTRRRWDLAFAATVGIAAAIILMTQLGDLVASLSSWQVWLMAGLASLSGVLAFIERPPPGRVPMVVCPTICFTFAILLCYGPGPAIAAQTFAVALVTWRLRCPPREAFEVATQYAVAMGAAGVVLWIGQPDPFQRNGPTNLLADAVTVLVACLTWLAVFGILSFISTWLRGSKASREAVLNQILFKAALLLLSPVLAVAAHINVGFVPLVFVPLFAVQRMARLSAERDRAARMDPLTKLANRTGLRDGFDDLVTSYHDGRRQRPPERATVLLLDLDRFKDVNDALGHEVGDQLLIAVADRISAVPPKDATVARLGGDEFAILTRTARAEEATQLAQDIVAALAQPVVLDRLRIDVTASVGIARHSDDQDDFADVMRQADVAMYDAKQRGDTVAVYSRRTDCRPERLGLLIDFREALESGDRTQIAMHYQPQVSIATGEVEGVEALLRWCHPVHGSIATPELLGVVERSSVMQMLTARVIEEVVMQVADWNEQGLVLRASLNISARDLYCDNIVQHLARQLATHDVAPGQIQVEITESALLADPIRAQATVGRIAALGVSVSLDDFGTGYSSLQHLRKLPISEIKIDRAFVTGMADNRDDAAIVRSTVEMARMLGIRTVAEGVENEYTRQLLAEAGCTSAQGWLTAKPMPAIEITNWLAGRLRAARPTAGTIRGAPSPKAPPSGGLIVAIPDRS
jgi:diguanylate cyclase (GGDEF)-like protein